MSSFVESVTGILRDRTCNLLANPLIDGRQWGPRPPFVGDGVGSNPLTRRWYNNAIDGLRSIFCDGPVEQVDNVLPPFTGGQCDCGEYRITFVYRARNSANTSSMTRRVRGPILGVRVTQQSLGTEGPACAAGSGNTSVNFLIQANCRGMKGNFNPEPPCSDQAWRTAGSQVCCPATDSNVYKLISYTVFPSANQTEDCGDPPPIYEPVNVFNFTENITYIDNSNNTVNELGDFNLFAPIFLPGSIQIPFNLNVGEVNFSGSLFPNGTINISPDFNIQVGSENDPSPTDEPDLDEDQEYEIEPSEEQESRIVGAWVVVTQDSARATQVAEGGVTHFYPRQGILKFRMAFGSSGFTYSPGVDVKTRRAYIPVPRTGRAIGADWFGYSGNSATVTLAYAEITPNLLPASD